MPLGDKELICRSVGCCLSASILTVPFACGSPPEPALPCGPAHNRLLGSRAAFQQQETEASVCGLGPRRLAAQAPASLLSQDPWRFCDRAYSASQGGR